MSIELKPGDRYSIEGRYYNANGFAVAIVASINHEVDWAAYIGATGDDKREAQTIQAVLELGCKLPEQDARYFFPELKSLPYRH